MVSDAIPTPTTTADALALFGFEAGVPELYWSTSTRLRVFDLVRRQDYGIRVALSQLNAMA